MKSTQLNQNIQKQLDALIAQYAPLAKIIAALKAAGGVPYLVGGAVRDLLLGLPVKDVDIEVHGLSMDALENTLRAFGIVDLVGKAYGVLRIHGIDIDWSVPRIDEVGRKPQVAIDPNMALNVAFERRDLTVNAMGINLLTSALIDPFNGYDDLQQGILRATNAERFAEDPLRFYRVMQFLARFGFKPDMRLNEICSHIAIHEVSKERISQEFEKWLLKSKKPSLALDWLDHIGRLQELFPELAALKKIEQNPAWHPEGDVYEHSKQALDAAARSPYRSDDEKILLMYAALCHDLGKATTTELVDDKIISHGHELESERLTKQMMKRITNNKELIERVAKLVRYHMHPGQFVKNGAKSGAYKRLAHTLSPDLTMRQLALLYQFDCQGRNPQRGNPLDAIEPNVGIFIKNAERDKVLEQIEEPLLQGRDFMPAIEPGPLLGTLVKEAYRLQLDEGIKDKDELKRRVLQSVKH